MGDWLIVGISGVTCSGKTSLSNEIRKHLPDSVIVNQDDYFYPIDSSHHKFIPELDHINFDIISSLDMDKMLSDVLRVINGTESYGARRVLIVDGFLIFNYKPIADLCNLKYFININKDLCWDRRKVRTYDPPDVPGYFENIVWPEYLNNMKEIKNDIKLYKEIVFLDGSRSKKSIFDQVYLDIKNILFN